jgi:hypothetical protein
LNIRDNLYREIVLATIVEKQCFSAALSLIVERTIFDRVDMPQQDPCCGWMAGSP